MHGFKKHPGVAGGGCHSSGTHKSYYPKKTEGATLLQVAWAARPTGRSTRGYSQRVVRHMMADGTGRIVNISSIIASTGYNGLSVYAASKAAAAGFSRSLAREVGRLGITVNAIAPGFVDTELTGSLDDGRRSIAGRSALRHLPEANDVASMVEFLLGEGGRNITGTVLTVDAGNTA